MLQRVYVDTSALAALLLDQPHSEPLADWLDETPAELVSSDLLETEMRRIAVREALPQGQVSELLAGVSLATPDRAVYRGAGLLPIPHLRSLDAVHLESAIRLAADAVLTYDVRLAEAAQAVGLGVVTPGA
ncbi:type II toxin-antitoxin system VapC family toxin [Micrococcus sp.]|uniref:type II toxin-antitoxin system VapC family toxin n=1 Tax=Micrococcus sp. TaxID=1271 RepID=UPI002A916BFD|nr:type II toxin-antitoxin system VapC family toxin [Micrococcus sp.]MDY6054270.1 type II toxin-antitoxin system VapC family toxin [Micrococcus sp.]